MFPRLSLLIILCGTLLAQTNPVPFVNQPLVPETAAPAGNGFTLTVNGTGFVSGAVVKWNGSSRSTTFVSSSKLKATIPASDIASAMTAAVTVTNPAPGGGTSDSADFKVTPPAPSVQMWAKDINLKKGLDVVALAVADFNGDKNSDLAVLSRARKAKPGRLDILLGDGAGHLTKSGFVSIEGSLGLYENPMISADFDADGKADIAFVNARNQVGLLLGKGDGTFQQQRNFFTGIDPSDLAAADFNSDGYLDLVTANSADDTLSVLLGQGNGTFSTVDVPTRGVTPVSLAVGDFNQDGVLDLAVAELDSDEVTIMTGNGDGTFSLFDELFPFGSVRSVVAGDLNADGRLDLVASVQPSRGFDVVYLGGGDGSFQQSSKLPALGYQGNSVADMNGDGLIDIAVAQGYGSIRSLATWLGEGTGQFELTYSRGAGNWTGPFGQRPLLADFNSDGKLDSVVPQSDSGSEPSITVLFQSPMTLSPSKLGFGYVKVGKNSTPLGSTLTNSGTVPVKLDEFVFGGLNAGDFSQTNDCPASLAPGATCTIQVKFAPTSFGKRKAFLRVFDDASGGHQDLPVHGIGRS
jgi:hypothetical protein